MGTAGEWSALARLASSVAELRTFVEQPICSMEIGALIRHCVNGLSPGAPPARHVDHRITIVLNAIRARDDLRMPFSGMTNLFELKWYSENACETADYHACRALAEEIRSEVSSP